MIQNIFFRIPLFQECVNRYRRSLDSRNTSEVQKIHIKISVTLNLKVTREGHVHENILFEFPDISNLIINT